MNAPTFAAKVVRTFADRRRHVQLNIQLIHAANVTIGIEAFAQQAERHLFFIRLSIGLDRRKQLRISAKYVHIGNKFGSAQTVRLSIDLTRALVVIVIAEVGLQKRLLVLFVQIDDLLGVPFELVEDSEGVHGVVKLQVAHDSLAFVLHYPVDFVEAEALKVKVLGVAAFGVRLVVVEVLHAVVVVERVAATWRIRLVAVLLMQLLVVLNARRQLRIQNSCRFACHRSFFKQVLIIFFIIIIIIIMLFFVLNAKRKKNCNNENNIKSFKKKESKGSCTCIAYVYDVMMMK